MKTKLFITVLTCLCIAACNKDAFTTKPQITFKSVNTQVLASGQVIRFTLRYTDKEGDIQNKLYVQKVTQNCSLSDADDEYSIPGEIPTQKNGEGDIVVTYGYGPETGYPPIKEPACPGQNDTCIFRFALTDKANNTSDTITSPQIVLLKR